MKQERKEKVTIYLFQKEKKFMKRLAREKGVSFSGLVNLALSNLETQEKISEAEQQLPALLERFLNALSTLNEKLEKLEERIARLENWTRYNAYQSTLAVQLAKTKLNNYLRLEPKQYEQYKQHFWPQIHKDVQKIIQEVTGQEVVPWEKD